jgi:hypothetical protein
MTPVGDEKDNADVARRQGEAVDTATLAEGVPKTPIGNRMTHDRTSRLRGPTSIRRADPERK